MTKPLQVLGKYRKFNAEGRQCVNTIAPLEHKHLVEGGDDMSRYGQYTDSESVFNTNWKSISELARELVDKAKAGGK